MQTKSPVRRYTVAAVTLTMAAAYCLAFLVRPPTTWPGPIRDTIKAISKTALTLTRSILELCGVESATFATRSGLYMFIIAALIPWAIMALLQRGRPSDLGLRLPNQYGWRLLVVTYLLSLPFLVWMIQSPGFAGPYLSQLQRAGGIAFCLFYTLNMLTEHFFMQGVVLAALRMDRRWPPPATPIPIRTASVVAKKLQWLGLAQPTDGATGLRKIERWLGMSEGCVFAILGSGLLFALVHVGKNPRELLLSLPGGIALAILSYRTNTWLTAFVLHLATAGTAFALVLLSR